MVGVIRSLRLILTAAWDTTLQQKPSQSKLMECVASDPTSSHFMRSGRHTRFAEWRFAYRARLNLLPLNDARPWAAAADQRCRACGYQHETLPHVLYHCMVQSRALTNRHDKVVSRVKAAATGRFTITHENRPIGDTSLRPDLVLAQGEDDLITDICCPFENRRAALEEARQHKIRKYEPVRQFLLRRFQKVVVEAALCLAAFTKDEVAVRLRRCENTAPGGDRLTYHHWRTVDTEGSFRAAVFNYCLRHRRVLARWRASRTVLIYKKGEKRAPTNWRPISFGSTIAKLYAVCLASRLQGGTDERVTRLEPPREPDPVELSSDTVSPEPPRDPTSGEPEGFLPTAGPAPDEGDANITLSGSIGDANNPTTDESQRDCHCWTHREFSQRTAMQPSAY
ncbi:hypothetical protein IscW_ISCW003797 [Ixodes scapularis]|uniref:Reverse transcriptase n=1 Tax=Ixodes scapularis TaxID=6945 RepID=B7PEB8_IXOSC|nr:hypothetical protein IscW_ISCW003797 [Ixodes scapularis]|eukprot:XP_002400806.1 hypothetical protein IscW_ISCW003797 [Ixodes scapularis]